VQQHLQEPSRQRAFLKQCTTQLTLKLLPSAINPDPAENSDSQLLSDVLTAMEFMGGVSKRYCPGVLVVRTVTVWKRAKFCKGCAPTMGIVTMLKGGGACCVRAMTPGLGGPPGKEEAATLMLLGAAWSSVLALKPMSRASRRKTLWCMHAHAEDSRMG
jgi:hypothetical protein